MPFNPTLVEPFHADVFDIATGHQFQSGFWEDVGAAAGEAFEWTTIKRFWDDIRSTMDADPYPHYFNPLEGATPEERDQYDPLYRPAGVINAIPKKEWEQSEYYRPGLKHDKYMTPTRARVLAELYDERRYRELIHANSPGGVFRWTAKFVAGMAATALDPVNYIPLLPFHGGGVLRRALIGGGEAFLGTALFEPAIASELEAQGYDGAWEEWAYDLMLSGGFGMLFGGGLRLLQKRGLHQQSFMDTVARATDDQPANVGPIHAQAPDANVDSRVDYRTEHPARDAPPVEYDEAEVITKKSPDQQTVAQGIEEQYQVLGVDENTLSTLDVERVNEMAEAGDLHPDDAAEVTRTRVETEKLTKEAEALEAVAHCLTR